MLLNFLLDHLTFCLLQNFITLGEGGWFSSSEKEGEQGFRRRRVGLGVAGGDGDGVVG